MKTFEYRFKDLEKFDKETWVEYAEVFTPNNIFYHKIKNIPSNHVLSRFNIVPQEEVEMLRALLGE